jgi:Rrf2 family protein
MILSKTSEYAIRVATTLALLPSNALVGASILSKQTKIPPHYLSKILRKLVDAEILQVKKGPSGGYCFNAPLRKITLLSILEAVDFNIGRDHCPFGWKKCNSTSPCPLHESYSVLKKNYLAWAEGTTLRDLHASHTDT